MSAVVRLTFVCTAANVAAPVNIMLLPTKLAGSRYAIYVISWIITAHFRLFGWRGFLHPMYWHVHDNKAR